MYFIVWVYGFARTPDDELPPPIPRTSLVPEHIDEEENERSGERKKRKRRRWTRLQNSVIKKERVKTRMLIRLTWANGRRVQSTSSFSESKSHSLKQRQLNLLAAGVKRAVEDINNQDQRARKRALEETRQRWISLVMMREGDVPLLQSVSNAYHSNIEEGKNTLQRKKNNNNGC